MFLDPKQTVRRGVADDMVEAFELSLQNMTYQ